MKKLIKTLFFLIPILTSSQDCKYLLKNQIKDVTKINNNEFVLITDNFKITKVNADFDTIWENSNLDTANNFINKIQSTYDGGFIGSGSSPEGNLFKMNSIGDTVWTNQCQVFNFGPFGGYNIIDIIQTLDSGFAFVAVYGHMSYYSMVVKTNQFGDTIWTKTNIIPEPNSWDNQVKTINETNNGNLILSGEVNVNFPTNSNYSYLYKLNSNGDSIWAKTFNDFEFNSVTVDDSENILIAGKEINNSNINESKIMKTNSLGDTIWSKTIQANSVNCIQLADGGYIFGGSKESITFFNSSYLFKTNINGDVLWTKVYPEDTVNRELKMIFNILDNDYLLLGEESSNFPPSSNQIDYKIQVDSLGFCPDNNISEIVDNFSCQISIYPNPTKEIINISAGNFNGNIQTQVYDLIGKKLQTTNKNSVSLRDYSKGIYILKVAYGYKVEEVKVIKD
jgi:hypothetical protein